MLQDKKTVVIILEIVTISFCYSDISHHTKWIRMYEFYKNVFNKCNY